MKHLSFVFFLLLITLTSCNNSPRTLLETGLHYELINEAELKELAEGNDAAWREDTLAMLTWIYRESRPSRNDLEIPELSPKRCLKMTDGLLALGKIASHDHQEMVTKIEQGQLSTRLGILAYAITSGEFRELASPQNLRKLILKWEKEDLTKDSKQDRLEKEIFRNPINAAKMLPGHLKQVVSLSGMDFALEKPQSIDKIYTILLGNFLPDLEANLESYAIEPLDGGPKEMVKLQFNIAGEQVAHSVNIHDERVDGTMPFPLDEVQAIQVINAQLEKSGSNERVFPLYPNPKALTRYPNALQWFVRMDVSAAKNAFSDPNQLWQVR